MHCVQKVHCMPFVLSCLVFAAFTQLQTGQDLALDGLDPRISLLHTLGFKVPSLAGARHDEEVKVILI
uniref:Uncharacterized protein n=1 Tax=Echeneis naucrates TaxID=173247 RepID=A0A665XB01_ECHNA